MSKVICINVDGTLIFWQGENPGRVPRKGELGYGELPTINKKLIEEIKFFKRAGSEIVIWSGGGKKHAEWACEFTGITKYVDFICSKPYLLIDDKFKWLDRVETETIHAKHYSRAGHVIASS